LLPVRPTRTTGPDPAPEGSGAVLPVVRPVVLPGAPVRRYTVKGRAAGMRWSPVS